MPQLHAPGPEPSLDFDLAHISQYPDPEPSTMESSAWRSLARNHADGENTSPLQTLQDGAHGTPSLVESRAEFESSSARRRSQSRELSEESDFLGEVSDG
jgi:general transcription factor 3C polypeptide 3 (transcription factor C subunit 4)